MKEIIDFQQFGSSLVQQLKGKRLIRIPLNREIFKGRLQESAVLMLSDIHWGKINQFLAPESDTPTITYNTEIALREAGRLVESVYSLNQLLSAGYQLDKLYIFGLGDLIDNDIIYKGQRFFIEVGAGQQVVDLVKVLSDMLVQFLKMFHEIEFIVIGGNHSRFGFPETAPASNSFDYLIGKMLEMVFKDEPRVKIVVPDSWFYVHKIYNWRYLLHHGNTTYSWMSLPYYGVVRQGKARRVEIPHEVECIAHFHQRMEIPISSTSMTLVNGSWIEKDDFAWRKFGILSKPEQYYFGVSPKRPRTWSFNLELKRSITQELKELRR